MWFGKGDQELEVRSATYGPVIDQSQHAKSISHVIIACYSIVKQPEVEYLNKLMPNKWLEKFNNKLSNKPGLLSSYIRVTALE